MRIRRVQNRVYKGKEYERWLLTVPPTLVQEMGWDDKTEVQLKKKGKWIVISVKRDE